MIVEQVPATDLLQVYSGLESDEVANGIMVDAAHHVVEEPSMLVGGVDLSGTGKNLFKPAEVRTIKPAAYKRRLFSNRNSIKGDLFNGILLFVEILSFLDTKTHYLKTC